MPQQSARDCTAMPTRRPGLHPPNAHAPGPPVRNTASPYATLFHRIERPLHPGRFRDVLASLAERCCVLRGQLWIASAPACRIAIQGIGPRMWLENLGPWTENSAVSKAGNASQAGKLPASHGAPAATVISATGEGLDAAQFGQLLLSCQLTDEELASHHQTRSTA